MKVQISRFSPSQNGKVFAVLMAIGSLVFVVPMVLMFAFMPSVDAHGNAVPRAPVFMFLVMPFFYLVFGYLMVVVSCWLYNVMFRHIGGIEFETQAREPT